MMVPMITEILEKLGFAYTPLGGYTGKFYYSPTGRIITIKTRDDFDECGCPQLLFDAFDTEGNILSTQTLDQVIREWSSVMDPLPKKSNKQYASTYIVKFQVPVDMRTMSEEEFHNMVIECESADEIGLAELKARLILGEFLEECPFLTLEIEPEETNEI